MPTSRGALRGAVIGIGLDSAPKPVHHTVFEPWRALAESAAARYQEQIARALEAEQSEVADAGALLDHAHATAQATAGKLRAAAWAAFEHFQAMADAAEHGALAPALAAYQARITQAHDRFALVLTEAEKTYKRELADADRAKADAAAMKPAG